MPEEDSNMVCELGPMRTLRESRGKRHRRGKKRNQGRAAAVHPPDLHSSKSGGERGTDEDSIESESEMSLLGSLAPSKHVGKGRLLPSLRPIVVPKAPENSTQFLIDDHEDSTLFLNFENSYKSPSWCGPMDDPEEYFPSNPGEDEGETLTQMYYMRDFESEYQSAKEEVLLDWTREMLFEEILKLERKASSLETLLNLQDPHKYLSSLQKRLLELQEENRQLQASLRCSDRSSSGPTSDDDIEPYQRDRADTASDLVMVVAPLSLQDASLTIDPHHLCSGNVQEMETS